LKTSIYLLLLDDPSKYSEMKSVLVLGSVTR